MLATIGYEKATPEDFVETLRAGNIEILVDIRDRAQSRRRGFSKTALANAVESAGIQYMHLRALGDPKEGRDAARAGNYEEFKRIFGAVLASEPAQIALDEVIKLARVNRICLMCYERDHRYCHRKIVSDAIEKTLGVKAVHLGVGQNVSEDCCERRVLHTCKSATASV